jgi:hypothetical protein
MFDRARRPVASVEAPAAGEHPRSAVAATSKEGEVREAPDRRPRRWVLVAVAGTTVSVLAVLAAVGVLRSDGGGAVEEDRGEQVSATGAAVEEAIGAWGRFVATGELEEVEQRFAGAQLSALQAQADSNDPTPGTTYRVVDLREEAEAGEGASTIVADVEIDQGSGDALEVTWLVTVRDDGEPRVVQVQPQ